MCGDANRAVVSGSRDAKQNYAIVCAERGRQFSWPASLARAAATKTNERGLQYRSQSHAEIAAKQFRKQTRRFRPTLYINHMADDDIFICHC
jgi:hypothetical protein